MKTDRDSNVDKTQADEYIFPYHYIPSEFAFPKFARAWSFSASYIAAIRLFSEWLQEISLKNSNSHKHLDVGCGDGGFVNAINGTCKFPNVDFYGIDYDEKAIFWANAFNQDAIFECADLSSLESNSFDSASLIEVIEHIPPVDLPNFIADTAAILKADGQLLVTVPSTEELVGDKHYQHFNFDKIQQIFKNDFEIISCFGFQRKTFLSRVIRKLLVSKWCYIEVKFLSNYLIETFQRRYPVLSRCGRIILILKKKP